MESVACPHACDPATGVVGTVSTGDAAVPEQADTLAAGGVVQVRGAAATTERADTVGAAGTLPVQGAAGITEQRDTATAAGALAVRGSAALAQVPDTTTGAGQVAVRATSNSFHVADTLAATARSLVQGFVGWNEAPDTLAASGTVRDGPHADADIIEGADALVASGVVSVVGALDVFEVADTLTTFAFVVQPPIFFEPFAIHAFISSPDLPMPHNEADEVVAMLLLHEVAVFAPTDEITTTGRPDAVTVLTAPDEVTFQLERD